MKSIAFIVVYYEGISFISAGFASVGIFVTWINQQLVRKMYVSHGLAVFAKRLDSSLLDFQAIRVKPQLFDWAPVNANQAFARKLRTDAKFRFCLIEYCLDLTLRSRVVNRKVVSAWPKWTTRPDSKTFKCVELNSNSNNVTEPHLGFMQWRQQV